MAGQVHEIAGDDGYRAACCEIADELGFTASDVWFWWNQCWMVTAKATGSFLGVPSERLKGDLGKLAKFQVYMWLRDLFDKRGRMPS